MRKRLPPLLLLLAALLLGVSHAQAEMVNYSYSWTALPSTVIPGGTGSVTLATVDPGNASSELGAVIPTFIPGATVTTTSSAGQDVPDSFNTDFSMVLHLTEGIHSGDLTFEGTLAGTLTADTSSLTSTFHNPVTQTLTLGDHIYTVTIDPSLVNIPAPGSSAPALIDALVTVAGKPVVDPNPAEEMPEPGSLVLSATAIASLAARRMLRRRKAA